MGKTITKTRIKTDQGKVSKLDKLTKITFKDPPSIYSKKIADVNIRRSGFPSTEETHLEDI